MDPLCFVLMPFGKKMDPNGGGTIDFDAVYNQILRPAIVDAGMSPIRADEEQVGGIIHKPMFERLVLCEYAVADLTTANANVFYELGVRHANRSWATLPVFANGSRILFDVDYLRAVPYSLSMSGVPDKPDEDRKVIANRLVQAKNGDTDSPIFQLLENYPNVDQKRADAFREQVQYSNDAKRRLSEAKAIGVNALRNLQADLEPLQGIEAGLLVELLLSYRAVNAFAEMVDLVAKLPPHVAATVVVQEQLGLALNRLKRREEAGATLAGVRDRQGPSSETLGILGRIQKDRWDDARKAGKAAEARAHLKKAIESYFQGFNADTRDAYPGVNAVTLMELSESRDPRQAEMLPVVAYAVRRKVERGGADYWDYATLLELAVLTNDDSAMQEWLGETLSAATDSFGLETTLRNLTLLKEARNARSEDTTSLDLVLKDLSAKRSEFP